MIQHLSVRIPWKDNGYDGYVCKKPCFNNSCCSYYNIFSSTTKYYNIFFNQKCGVQNQQKSLKIFKKGIDIWIIIYYNLIRK